jgi:WhiB family transcriptional regulator, redox-sensing transcriptional regulator
MTGAAQGWGEQAACLDMNTELFFPNGTTGPAVEQTVEAKAVCARCPVVAQCLAAALVMNEVGIWGGMTEQERRILRRRRRKRH